MLEDDVLEKQAALLLELKSNKQSLLHELNRLTRIREIIPGEANFVLIRVDEPDELLSFCAASGVIIRGFPADPLLRNYVRISVGTMEDINALASVLQQWENAK